MIDNEVGSYRQASRSASNNLTASFLHQSRGTQIIIGNVLVQTIGSIFFFTRIFSRLVMVRCWFLEDWFLVGAWVFSTMFSTCVYVHVAHGAGHHLLAIMHENRHEVVVAMKWVFGAQIICLFASAAPKLSVCSTYLRLFKNDTWGRRWIKAIGILVTFPLPYLFFMFSQCRPLEVYWTENRPLSKCLNDVSTPFVRGTINVTADLGLIAIVLPRVLRLNLDRHQKRALVTTVYLGFLAAGAAIIRMIRVGLDVTKKVNYDPFWDGYDLYIWTATEYYVGITCASAPGVKRVLGKLFPTLLEQDGSYALPRTLGNQLEANLSNTEHSKAEQDVLDAPPQQ